MLLEGSECIVAQQTVHHDHLGPPLEVAGAHIVVVEVGPERPGLHTRRDLEVHHALGHLGQIWRGDVDGIVAHHDQPLGMAQPQTLVVRDSDGLPEVADLLGVVTQPMAGDALQLVGL